MRMRRAGLAFWKAGAVIPHDAKRAGPSRSSEGQTKSFDATVSGFNEEGRMRRLSSALALASTMALAFSQQALAATVTAPVLVSGPSPYANCTIGGGAGATNYVNAEVEPYVAVNPATAGNVIGVWQQDRWSDGG